MRSPRQAHVSTSRTLTHGSLPLTERHTVTRLPSHLRSSEPTAATSEFSGKPRVQRGHFGGSQSHVASPSMWRPDGDEEGSAPGGRGAFVGLAVGPGATGARDEPAWSSGIRAFGLLVALDRHVGPSDCPLVGTGAGTVETFGTTACEGLASFASEEPTWPSKQPLATSIAANASPNGRMSAGACRPSPRTTGRRGAAGRRGSGSRSWPRCAPAWPRRSGSGARR